MKTLEFTMSKQSTLTWKIVLFWASSRFLSVSLSKIFSLLQFLKSHSCRAITNYACAHGFQCSAILCMKQLSTQRCTCDIIIQHSKQIECFDREKNTHDFPWSPKSIYVNMPEFCVMVWQNWQAWTDFDLPVIFILFKKIFVLKNIYLAFPLMAKSVGTDGGSVSITAE